MTREEFFRRYSVGSILNANEDTQEYYLQARVVSKAEWSIQLNYGGASTKWDPDHYLHVVLIGGSENGTYDAISWSHTAKELIMDAVIQKPKSDMYCSCNGKAKKSTMFYGDLFYVCEKCGKEKR